MLSKNNLLLLFFQFLLTLLHFRLSLSIISIPFKLNISNDYKSYNSTDFYNAYFNRSIFLEMNIGTPSKKINAALTLKSSCFYFSNNNSNSNTNKYYPINSSSFKLNGKSNIYTDLKNANDIIYFPDIKQNQKLSFLLKNDIDINIMNNNYMPIIGLDDPYIIYGRTLICPCPNIFHDLKQAKLIKKKIWTIKFNSKYNGEFIIGGELYEYNGKKYHEELYTKASYDPQYSIIFDSIYTINKINNRIKYINEKNSNRMNKKAFININSGVIIGTEEYKNYIDSNFFNNLIKRKICQVDSINDYLIYSCNIEFNRNISQQNPSTNYYSEFPELIFSSKKLEYNFIFKSKDLFEQIFDKYYFLIIFKNNTKDNSKDSWYLGEPFYRKYTFSINFNSRAIGFYFEEKGNDNQVNDINNNNKIDNTKIMDDMNNYNKNNNNNINNKILKYFIEVIIVIGIVFIAFYIGITIKEKRKKRANELKDDNYEYMPEQNKDINEINNTNKKEKLVELNSRLGL